MAEEKEGNCVLCSGTGKSKLTIDNFYVGTINDYMYYDSKERPKHRIRIEISRKFHEALLEKFDAKDEVAIFLIPLDKYKKETVMEDFVEMMDEGEAVE